VLQELGRSRTVLVLDLESLVEKVVRFPWANLTQMQAIFRVSRARQRSFRSVFRRLTLSLRCRSVHRAAHEAAEGPDVGFAGVRGLLDDLGSHPVD
jgi:hypothetical protein